MHRLSRFSRAAATEVAQTLSDAELSLAIHVVCSAFSSAHFPGVETLDHVRQMADVLEHERDRRVQTPTNVASPERR